MPQLVLIIEDDLQLGRQLVERLRKAGYATQWWTEGRAITAQTVPAVDLVVLDLMLPGVAGLDLLKQLRERSEVPVLVLSARNDTRDKVRALQLGADDYMTKPFWPEELVERVRARLRRPGLQRDDAIRVGDVEIGLYASDAYLADHPAPRSVEDLGEHALVGGDRDRGVTQLRAAFGLSTSPRDFALRTDDHLAQLAAVRAGLGVGVCQGPLAGRPPKLTRVLSEVKFPLPVWVVMHEDLRAVRRVRTVFDHLVVELDAYLGARPRRRRRPR